MNIQNKLYSENYSEEVLYSILLDGDEYALYSEFQKEFGKKTEEKTDPEKAIKTGVGITAAGFGLNTASGKIMKKLEPGSIHEGASNRLKDRARSSGIKVNEHQKTGQGPLYSHTRKTIFTDGSKSAASIGHELGHAEYLNGKKPGKVGKLSHKAYLATGGGLNPSVLQPVGSIAAGWHSGKKAARLEAEGKNKANLKDTPVL